MFGSRNRTIVSVMFFSFPLRFARKYAHGYIDNLFCRQKNGSMQTGEYDALNMGQWFKSLTMFFFARHVFCLIFSWPSVLMFDAGCTAPIEQIFHSSFQLQDTFIETKALPINFPLKLTRFTFKYRAKMCVQKNVSVSHSYWESFNRPYGLQLTLI